MAAPNAITVNSANPTFELIVDSDIGAASPDATIIVTFSIKNDYHSEVFTTAIIEFRGCDSATITTMQTTTEFYLDDVLG